MRGVVRTTTDKYDRDISDFGVLSERTQMTGRLFGAEMDCSDGNRGIQAMQYNASGGAHGASVIEGCTPTCVLDEVSVTSGWVLVWNTLRSEYDAKEFTADSVICAAGTRWAEIVYDGTLVTLQAVANLTDGSVPIAFWEANNTFLDTRMSRKTRTRNANGVNLPFDTIVGGLNSANKFEVRQVDDTVVLQVDTVTPVVNILTDLVTTGDVRINGDDIRDSGNNIVFSFDGAGNLDANITFAGAQTVDGVDISAHDHGTAGGTAIDFNGNNAHTHLDATQGGILSTPRHIDLPLKMWVPFSDDQELLSAMLRTTFPDVATNLIGLSWDSTGIETARINTVFRIPDDYSSAGKIHIYCYGTDANILLILYLCCVAYGVGGPDGFGYVNMGSVSGSGQWVVWEVDISASIAVGRQCELQLMFNNTFAGAKTIRISHILFEYTSRR